MSSSDPHLTEAELAELTAELDAEVNAMSLGVEVEELGSEEEVEESNHRKVEEEEEEVEVVEEVEEVEDAGHRAADSNESATDTPTKIEESEAVPIATGDGESEGVAGEDDAIEGDPNLNSHVYFRFLQSQPNYIPLLSKHCMKETQ